MRNVNIARMFVGNLKTIYMRLKEILNAIDVFEVSNDNLENNIELGNGFCLDYKLDLTTYMPVDDAFFSGQRELTDYYFHYLAFSYEGNEVDLTEHATEVIEKEIIKCINFVQY